LLELSNGEFAFATINSTKDIFDNWIEKCMCGDYQPINKKTKSNHYPMPTSKELFNSLGEVNVFNTLDFKYGYHQLLLEMED
jgi:hypothetical protein